MSISIDYQKIDGLKVNPSYKEKICILDKNQECAIKNVKDCKKTFKKCGWCKQKCLCNKVKQKKNCNKIILQNGVYNVMSKESYLFYRYYFLPKFINNPKLSRYNYPDKNMMTNDVFLKKYIKWLSQNKQFYSYWCRMFASQQSPSVYEMGSTMVFGDS